MLQYLIAAIIFVVLDGIYLNLIKSSYNTQINRCGWPQRKINACYRLRTSRNSYKYFFINLSKTFLNLSKLF